MEIKMSGKINNLPSPEDVRENYKKVRKELEEIEKKGHQKIPDPTPSAENKKQITQSEFAKGKGIDHEAIIRGEIEVIPDS
jgi:hypothetical protein